MNNKNFLGIAALQLGLSQLCDGDGAPYYADALDGKAGPGTRAAIYDLAKDLGLMDLQDSPKIDLCSVQENQVMVFSLKSDGEKYVSEHFRVREFACQDGSDVVLIHPQLPVWAEEIRKVNGPFSPNSAYRTVSHNKKIDGATYSKHCWGTAMDIPAAKATPLELYQAAEKIMGDSGGLGIYDWGIHMDCRQTKSRWKE